jgi:hypothetical protein
MESKTRRSFKSDPRIQRRLNQDQNQIHRIAQVALHAMDEASTTHSYATFKVASTLAAVGGWKQSLKAGDMSEEAEEWLEQLTQNYLRDMARLPAEANEKIALVLQRAASDKGVSDGTLGELQDALATVFS